MAAQHPRTAKPVGSTPAPSTEAAVLPVGTAPAPSGRMLHKPSESSMLADIWSKMPLLESVSSKLDKLCDRIEQVESKVAEIEHHVSEMDHGLSHFELDLEELKCKIESKADKSTIVKLETQIVDLVNRNKRNNVVLHNVPEGAEEDASDCKAVVHAFVRDALGIPHSMEMDRAHRTPMRMTVRPDEPRGNKRPRPIHVRFLRYGDRELVLKTAIIKRGAEFGGNRIFVSDDVHKSTREKHQQLMKKVKQLREDGHFAFIPWSVPRVIKYKEGGKGAVGPLKTIRDL